jgi:hypothetical protein
MVNGINEIGSNANLNMRSLKNRLAKQYVRSVAGNAAIRGDVIGAQPRRYTFCKDLKMLQLIRIIFVKTSNKDSDEHEDDFNKPLCSGDIQ